MDTLLIMDIYLFFVIDKDLDYSHRAPDEVLAFVQKGGVRINFMYVT